MDAGLSKPGGAGRLIRAAAAMVLSVALAACATGPRPAPQAGGGGGGTSATGTADAPATGPEVGPRETATVALLVPRSAEAEGASRLAPAIARAAEMAAQEVGRDRIRLQVYDTGGRPDRAAQVAERAVAAGADLLIGPLFATSTEAVRPIAAAAGLPVISFSTNTAVAGGPVYVSGYTPESEARRILTYAGSRGLARVGVFFPQNEYGDAAMQGARSAEDLGGPRIVVAQGYERSFKGIETASGPFAGDARGLGVDAVLLPAGGRELQAVGSFMNFHGIDPGRIVYLGLGEWNSRASFGEPALRGGLFAAPDPDAFADFAGRYRARWGEQPPVLATLGYDAVQVAVQALEAGGRAPFSRAVLTRPEGFRGALGPVRFNPDNSAERGMAILEVGEREFIVRDPAPFRLGAGS